MIVFGILFCQHDTNVGLIAGHMDTNLTQRRLLKVIIYLNDLNTVIVSLLIGM